MTAIEQIDEILKYLNEISIEAGTNSEVDSIDTNRKDLKAAYEIRGALSKKGIDIKQYELNLILFHLANEEKYILEDYKYYNNQRDNVPSFRILFAGKCFIEIDGGYKGKLNKENELKIRIEKNEQQTLRLSRYVAIGTIGLVIVEIIKLISEHFHIC